MRKDLKECSLYMFPRSPSPLFEKTLFNDKSLSSDGASSHADISLDPVREESFTIHLGTQMKQMHNLRLLSADVLKLIKYQNLDEWYIIIIPKYYANDYIESC